MRLKRPSAFSFVTPYTDHGNNAEFFIFIYIVRNEQIS